MNEIEDDRLAKHLLNGSNCIDCKFHNIGICSLFVPVKAPYPDDTQVFINGMLAYDGFSAFDSCILLIDGFIHINQRSNHPNAQNSTSFQLMGNEKIQIFSRGINKDGTYECIKSSTIFGTKNIPVENFCKHFISK